MNNQKQQTGEGNAPRNLERCITPERRVMEIAAQRDRYHEKLEQWQDTAMKLSHQVSEQTAKLQDCEQQRDELLAALKLVTRRLEYVLKQERDFQSVRINGHLPRKSAVLWAQTAIAKVEGRASGFSKQFKQTVWRAMEVVSQPTVLRGQIRKDEDGDLWEWKSGGLRVTAAALKENTPAQAQHSPENWKAFSETSSNSAGVADENGRLVAHVFGETKEQRRERSLLISAAPETKAHAERLAEALKRARSELGRASGHNCWKLCDDINEALAQWEGAQK